MVIGTDKQERGFMQMKPTKLTKDQTLQILKAGAYIGLSAVIGYFITLLTDNPELLGVYTPIVNIVLVTIKKIFTQE